MIRSSVRVQLTLWNVLVLVVVLFACGVALLWRMHAYLMTGIDKELQDRVTPLAIMRPPPQFPPQGPIVIGGPFHAMAARPGLGPPPPAGIGGVVAFGGAGGAMAGGGPIPGPSPQAGFRFFGGPPPGPGDGPPRNPGRFRFGGGDVRVLDGSRVDRGNGLVPFDETAFDQSMHGRSVWLTVLQGQSRWRVYSVPQRDPSGRIMGVVQAELPLATAEAEIADLTRMLLALIPLGVIAAALGGAFLTGRALRPVQQIATEVDRIQAENLDKRLPVHGSDEFARLGRTLNGMLGRLQASFEEQRRFTMDASHELKTPLTAIKAKTSVALTRERSADSYRSVIETIDHAADQMAEIVQDLLLLAQADSGQLGRNREAVSAREIAEKAIAGVWASDGPAIQVDMPEPAPTVCVNPGQLTRVLRNLLQNAVEHTTEEGCVRVGASANGDEIEITICDTGEGIAAEHIAHLTDRFYRVDSARSRKTGGTGLGLAICKSIIEAHGGRMKIESAIGAGTKVTLWLAGKCSASEADT